MEEELKKIKKENVNKIIGIKKGIFIHTYENDALIISYLMGYKLLVDNNQIYCSFPEKSMKKVEAVLDDNRLRIYILG